ncbi:MAG: alpha/beta hydrolase [Alphaproteobacteria bacterium]|nr:alpha/beta hydrolase [Alphaproteobacteria bacterium]
MSPPAPARPGPRPLTLHLATAAAISLGSRLGSAWSRHAWPSSNPDGRAAWESLIRSLDGLASRERAAFEAALEREARRRLDRFLTGVAAYRHHPYRRALADRPVLWSAGTTTLRDYGPAGRPVLVVPSLVNRAYVLDLAAETSFLRFLAAAGCRPLLVDWGTPGADERDFGLDDYIADRLGAALAVATRAAGGPVPVIGYCMGGLLALAAALARPEAVAGLVLLATPWDFHAATGGPSPLLAALRPGLMATIDALGELPVDVLQGLFFALDPTQSFAKFARFAALDPAGPLAARFVALEDWANDGVPLAAAVARGCIDGWYLENRPAAGRWRVAGRPVRPADWTGPALVVVPARDRIVPPEAAEALATRLPGAARLAPAAGHVGMVVGARARSAMWEPVAAWIAALDR